MFVVTLELCGVIETIEIEAESPELAKGIYLEKHNTNVHLDGNLAFHDVEPTVKSILLKDNENPTPEEMIVALYSALIYDSGYDNEKVYTKNSPAIKLEAIKLYIDKGVV